MWLYVADCLPVFIAPRLPKGVKAWRLGTTNPLCWEGRVDPLRGPVYVPDTPGLPRGTYHVAAAGEIDCRGGKKARCVVIGSSEALLTYTLQRYQDNLDFLLNSFNWLSDRTERVGISAKYRKPRILKEITPQKARNLKLVSLVVFPGLVLVFGLMVFLLRRR